LSYTEFSGLILEELVDKKQMNLLAANAGGLHSQMDDLTKEVMVLSKNGCDVDSFDPISDDGDAFRLAVVLGLKIEHNLGYVYVNDEFCERMSDHDDGHCGATRYAIVRAAVAIAKSENNLNIPTLAEMRELLKTPNVL